MVARGAVHIMTHANETGSPDPHCLLRLPLLAATPARWVLSLPVFETLDQLAASPWHDYVASLYAPFASDDFPIDLRCFTFWWHKRLPPALVAKHFVPNILTPPVPLTATMSTRNPAGRHERIHFAANGDVVPMGTQNEAWQIVMTSDVRRTSRAQPEPLSNGYEPDARSKLRLPFITPLRAGTRFEIFHEGSDCTVEKNRWQTEHITRHSPNASYVARKAALEDVYRHSAFWVHVAPGSGIWADVGRTLAAGTEGGHEEACAVALHELHVQQKHSAPHSADSSSRSSRSSRNGHGSSQDDIENAADKSTLAWARQRCGAHLFSSTHIQMAVAARALKYDTLQGLPCDDPHGRSYTVCRYAVKLITSAAKCGATAEALPLRHATWIRPFEVLLLGSGCDANGTACRIDYGACPRYGVLSRGRARRRLPCHCDSTRATVNCEQTCGEPPTVATKHSRQYEPSKRFPTPAQPAETTLPSPPMTLSRQSQPKPLLTPSQRLHAQLKHQLCANGRRGRHSGRELCCDKRCNRCAEQGCGTLSVSAFGSLRMALAACCRTVEGVTKRRSECELPAMCRDADDVGCLL